MKKLINLSELKVNDLNLEKETIGEIEFDVVYEDGLEDALLRDGFNLYSSEDITMEEVIEQDLTVDSTLLIDFMTENDFISCLDYNDNIVFIKQLPRNSEMIFKTIDTQLLGYDGKKCTIVRSLANDELDRFEVGNMYKVKFEDGAEITAFEDELSSAI